MGKLKALARRPTPPNTDQPEPAGAQHFGTQQSRALQHVAGDADRARHDSDKTVRRGVWNHFQYSSPI